MTQRATSNGAAPRDDAPAGGAPRGPSMALLVAEPMRAMGELLLGLAATPLLATAPRGDGHAVLVLPGLLADDSSTTLLRRHLRRLGHDVHGWRLGRNIGPTSDAIAGMHRTVAELVARSGGPISLVGWSLGGIFAREIARTAPHAVRQVVTLGSPFGITHSRQSRADGVYRRYAHRHARRHELPLEDVRRSPLPVPATSVYSRYDGIVSWRACLDVVDERHENIAVTCSHLGLGNHPAVLWVVADRLAQPRGVWRPFRPPALARGLFGVERPAAVLPLG